MRYALAVEYAGHAFCGFQSQPSRCGVQDALERAIGAIAGHPVTVSAAGRTDAGVHAVSQIVHFDTEALRPDGAWVRGVNAHLPAAAAVLWACAVDPAFHARFAATARHYTYLLLNRAERPGLCAGRAGWYHRPLDVEAMRAGAAHLAGTHDFSAFRAAECQAKSPVKTLSCGEIAAQPPFIRFDFSANAFLHHMVRNIVGALVYIGAGRQPPDWIATLLAARDRTLAAPTFAADGLYLAGADYDARFGLPPTVRGVAAALP
ncbi:MAG: tRNA pseudouridine(38-40) synthase TruA [Betaproteobacteria bacterium]|nr:tRNA pseudouridine(38-40) synthase TruA [Betaproteobacteria bacterium]